MHTHKSINPFIVLCCLLLVLFFNSATYGQNINICGFIIDKTTKEPLIGATVYCSENQQGTVTDNNGFFCMSVLNTKNVEFQFSFVGFQSFIHQFTLQSDTLISIELIPGISFKEIVVKTKYLTNNCSGVIEVPIKTINILPALTGEPDLLKGIQLMPGVKMGNEGQSNFYVRGGGFDQNLILLDDVTMYYVNHIGGILSVFDLNTIKKATLYKSYFPARFGGRLSSVLDIRLKDGNREKSKKKIMIGTLSSKLFMEGPLNNKVSGMFSVRRCNLDLFMRPMSRITNSGSETQIYTFYDLTGKLSYSINKRSKVISTLYSGRDKILFKEKYQNNNSYSNSFNNKWGNFLLSLKWNYVTSNNWFFESGLSYSLFFKNIINKQKQETKDANLYVESKFTSKINDIGFFSRVKKHYKLGSFQFGLKTISHFFTPSAISLVSKDKRITTDNTIFQNRVTNTEIQGFFENTLNLSEKTSIQPGIFIMGWTGLKNISIDPRINFMYNYFKNNHFNFSYSLNHQYLHLLSNNSNGIPTDLWVPSTKKLKPEKSEQFSFGLQSEYKNIEISIEMYYKRMKNLIFYKPGYTVFNTLNWESAVESEGYGKSKGIEFLIKKRKGKNTGWIGYTLSKSDRQFENLNNSNWFPFSFDRRHEINIVYSRKLSQNITFSSNWIFASGNYITLAAQKYPVLSFEEYGLNYSDNVFVEAHFYEGINNYRSAPYHRLDVGFNFNKELKKGKRTIYIGVYNVYNHKNPYYYYYAEHKGNMNLFQYSLFPIIPSISYSYTF